MILAAAIFVGDAALFVGLEEDDLTDAFVDVDAKREVCEVGEFDDEAARPTGFERRGVDQESGARVSRFTHRDAGHVARHLEGLDRHAQGVRVRRHEVIARAVFRAVERRLDERRIVEAFGIDLPAVEGREDAEAVVREAHVVAVGRRSGGDDASPVDLAHEPRAEGRDQLMLLRHAANPPVGFNCHFAGCSCQVL